jgi:hypothetical protein
MGITAVVLVHARLIVVNSAHTHKARAPMQGEEEEAQLDKSLLGLGYTLKNDTVKAS